jgi:hypothetical protein
MYIIVNIAQQLEYAQNCTNVDFDMLKTSNMAFLAYSMAKDNNKLSKGELKGLKELTTIISDKSNEYVKCLALNDKVTDSTLGDKYISTQIYRSNNLDEIAKNSLENGLTIIDIDECLKKLRTYHNLSDSESLNIVKTDTTSKLDDDIFNIGTKKVILSIYSLSDKKELNISICNDNSIKVKIPLKNVTSVITANYSKFKNESIDIYNPNDEIFISKCYKYTMNDFDTTVNFRRNKIFANKTISCNDQCTYSGIDLNGYVACDCNGISSMDDVAYAPEFVNYVFDSYENLNLDIVKCLNRAFNVTVYI